MSVERLDRSTTAASTSASVAISVPTGAERNRVYIAEARAGYDAEREPEPA